MREILPGHHVAWQLREVQTAAFSEVAAVFGVVYQRRLCDPILKDRRRAGTDG